MHSNWQVVVGSALSNSGSGVRINISSEVSQNEGAVAKGMMSILSRFVHGQDDRPLPSGVTVGYLLSFEQMAAPLDHKYAVCV